MTTNTLVKIDSGYFRTLLSHSKMYLWLKEQHQSEGRSWHVRLPCNDVAPFDLDRAIIREMSGNTNDHEGLTESQHQNSKSIL